MFPPILFPLQLGTFGDPVRDEGPYPSPASPKEMFRGHRKIGIRC